MPTITFLSLERQKLIDHKMIATTLQSHLQTTISQPTPPLKQNFLEVVNNKEVHFSINRTGNLLEGCAVWKDAKTKETDLCLYYYQKQ